MEVVERFLAIFDATHRKINYTTYCPKTVSGSCANSVIVLGDPLVHPGRSPWAIRSLSVYGSRFCDPLPSTRGVPMFAHTRWTDRFHPGGLRRALGWGQPLISPDREVTWGTIGGLAFQAISHPGCGSGSVTRSGRPIFAVLWASTVQPRRQSRIRPSDQPVVPGVGHLVPLTLDRCP